MKKIIAALLFIGAQSYASAPLVLLDCKIAWTDLQQIKIEKRNTQFVLTENKLKGRIEERAISSQEYHMNDYRLSNYGFYLRRLEKHWDNKWYLRVCDSAEEQIGQVDCEE